MVAIYGLKWIYMSGGGRGVGVWRDEGEWGGVEEVEVVIKVV